jgi:hypothetical protein
MADSYLKQSLLWCSPNSDFLFLSFFLYLLAKIVLVYSIILLSFVYLFINLVTSIWANELIFLHNNSTFIVILKYAQDYCLYSKIKLLILIWLWNYLYNTKNDNIK